MDSFLSTPVIWFAIGFILFLLEFAVPGFILFFFGFGAWVVAVTVLLTGISVNVQIFLFLGSSLLSALLFRNWVRNKLGMKKSAGQHLEDEIIGKTGRAETQIMPGKQGKVYFKGTSWMATSADIINEADDVIIIGHDSIVLIVKSL